ncbi:YdeI/OmpD-associated family protein [Paenibacillus kobensis]|uniref:YdeI/OmpD-associated family protein n=1 Tax=Paenibacillus kobensis TaxID=59841 RepID=UPI000FD993CD|nr:YdeI family protein [Paenibacillus kobensis]
MSNRLLHPKVDLFMIKARKWQEEYENLRRIVLDCGLDEDYKWMHPCYTFQNKNIVLIHGFKDYCALLFHKGALLKDPQSILIQQTENVQAARQIRFTSAHEIVEMESILKSYIQDAIEVEKAGLAVPFKKNTDYEIPAEFQIKLDEIPALRTAFESLTPGRQKGYLFYFSQAKQSKTREARVDKYLQHILDGKGMDD